MSGVRKTENIGSFQTSERLSRNTRKSAERRERMMRDERSIAKAKRDTAAELLPDEPRQARERPSNE